MKIAFIHNDKKIGTGAHFINDLIASKLKEKGVDVRSFYPRFMLSDTPIKFKGMDNILFFYSLLEKREEILKCDIIQGTTYTPLAFLRFSKPVISHFGSTTIGFLRAVPKTKLLEEDCASVFHKLKKDGVIKELNLKTRRPLNDIATIEKYAAERVDYIIATSEAVREDLTNIGIDPCKICVIHNAIEDYWFSDQQEISNVQPPSLIFLGRIGEDPFTLKLKGVGRLVSILNRFPEVPKLSIVMTRNKKLVSWLRTNIPLHTVLANSIKKDIPSLLRPHFGSIALTTSRYEGFCLSLIESMSQGIVPVSSPVGVAPEIIVNGVNGYIVNSVEEAEEKIKLLLGSRELRINMAREAKKTSELFRSEAMIEKLIVEYEKIINH